MDYSRFSQWSLIKCNLQNNVCLGMGSPAGKGSSSLLWDGLGQQPGQTAAGLSLLCQPTGSAYWNEWQVWSLILQGYLSQLQVPTCFLYTLRRKDKWDAYWPSFHERNFLMGWHFCPLGVGDKMETCKKYECMCLLGVSGVLQPLWSHSKRLHWGRWTTLAASGWWPRVKSACNLSFAETTQPFTQCRISSLPYVAFLICLVFESPW